MLVACKSLSCWQKRHTGPQNPSSKDCGGFNWKLALEATHGYCSQCFFDTKTAAWRQRGLVGSEAGLHLMNLKTARWQPSRSLPKLNEFVWRHCVRAWTCLITPLSPIDTSIEHHNPARPCRSDNQLLWSSVDWGPSVAASDWREGRDIRREVRREQGERRKALALKAAKPYTSYTAWIDRHSWNLSRSWSHTSNI